MPSETLKNFRGGSYGPPQKRKNWFFADFGGPITSPPQNFQRFWGHFHKPNFLSTIDYRKVNSWKINFWGVNWNFRFLGFFLIKNLKLKMLIFGSFRPKMKKTNDGFWKEMKSLAYKSTFIFTNWGQVISILIFRFFIKKKPKNLKENFHFFALSYSIVIKKFAL